MRELISDRLRRRVRGPASGAPLLTYYDPSAGVRVELSATSFANWVDKTTNLLVDELDLEEGNPVALDLVRTHRGHWVSLVWVAACWQLGAVVRAQRGASAPVLVVGPGGWSAARGTRVVTCSLHPFGLGSGDPGSDEVVDYDVDVRSQPDHFVGVTPNPATTAWLDDDRELSQLDLLAHPYGKPVRRLIRPSDPWATVAEALVEPLLTGGSSVIVTGVVSHDDLVRIATQEGAELPAGC